MTTMIGYTAFRGSYLISSYICFRLIGDYFYSRSCQASINTHSDVDFVSFDKLDASILGADLII